MADVKITKERKDDADDSVDPHKAVAPVMSMKQQTDKMRDGELWGLHCNACDFDQFTPMVRCTQCQSRDIEAKQFSSSGKVVSYTIQNVAPEIFMNEVPYAFAIIELEDGPKVSGWVPFISRPADLPIGSTLKFSPSYKPGIMFDKPENVY